MNHLTPRWSGKDFPLGGLFCLCLLATLAAACSPSEAAPTPPAALQVAFTDTVPPAPPPPATYTVVGVGDMMLGTNYPSTSYLPPNGGRDLLAEVHDLLRGADVTFGNLEGTILDSGGTPKTCRDMSRCYVFRSPEAYAQLFADAGFDFLSLANNHSGDFGPAGRQRTKATLTQAGIAFAGLAGTDETAIIERNGRRYGLAAFAPNSGTCDIRNLDRARQIVRTLAEQVDIVIVSFHGGAEGADHQHVPRTTETYLGENRGNVYAFAHAVVDAGADLVFGHGPHVSRAIELYQDRLICYSLGNFCTYGRFSLSGPAGLAPLVEATIDSAGVFQRGRLVSTYQQKTHGPRIDGQARALKVIQNLTRTDFPESPLRITDAGELLRAE